MGDRLKTLWVPGVVSLMGSMAWRLVLQRTVSPSQVLLNHAGLPLTIYLSWIIALPLFGGLSAYLSRHAGGNRSTRFTAAVFPSIVMIPLWIALATRMNHPSPRQFFGLFCGILYWIIIPGLALLLGALPTLKTHSVKLGSEN